MQRLTGLDASFLYLETPTQHMHVMGVATFDPTTAPEPITWERLVAETERRLHLVPSTRWRLAEVPFELHHPLWVDDPDFDLERHIFEVGLPAPGTVRELAALAAEIMSRPLDRSRPLWEMHLVHGLADGTVAVLQKTHHAAIDGVSGVQLAMALMDLTPEGTDIPPPAGPWRPERMPGEWELLVHAVGSLARQPGRVTRALGRNLVGAVRSAVDGLRGEGAAVPFAVPRTSFNGALSPHRSIAFAETELDRLKAVKRSLGGTVNDVVLAVCAGALRRYLEGRGERPDADLVAQVPISVRTPEEAGALGNRISSMLVPLGTTVDDPSERYRAIGAATARAKSAHNAIGADVLQNFAEFAPPAVAARAARFVSAARLADRLPPPYNLTVSNVPGPQFPLYSLGARMVASWPLGPVNEGTGLNITVTSYDGTMFWGVVADAELVPDPWAVTDGIPTALAELEALAASGS